MQFELLNVRVDQLTAHSSVPLGPHQQALSTNGIRRKKEPQHQALIKETRPLTMNIFFRKKYFLFKSFVKIELSYIFTINMVSKEK